MTRRAHVVLAALLAVGSLAPTPGDIGGCGQPPDLLDAPTFFVNKKVTDCRRCEECGLASDACTEACDASSGYATEFPPGCLPLVHDGEVCLRKLQHANCSDYSGYVADVGPTVPSECNFCPPRVGGGK